MTDLNDPIMRKISNAEIATYAIGLAVGAALVATAVRRTKAIAAAPQPKALTAAPVVILHPHRARIPVAILAAALRWSWCGESIEYFTCWRQQGHTGRHVDFDLATGHVNAVWPYEDIFSEDGCAIASRDVP